MAGQRANLTRLRATVSVCRGDGWSHRGEDAMVWKTPKITEIAVGMEINAYACAELT
jgi:coenzyme PQQ precursor peptide PqqA